MERNSFESVVKFSSNIDRDRIVENIEVYHEYKIDVELDSLEEEYFHNYIQQLNDDRNENEDDYCLLLDNRMLLDGWDEFVYPLVDYE